jgi:hypothetical protein
MRQGGGAGAGDGPLSPPAVRAQLTLAHSTKCQVPNPNMEPWVWPGHSAYLSVKSLYLPKDFVRQCVWPVILPIWFLNVAVCLAGLCTDIPGDLIEPWVWPLTEPPHTGEVAFHVNLKPLCAG